VTRAGHKACRQSGTPPQSLFKSSHGAGVGLMIVAQKVQQAMKGQNPELNAERMALLASLPACHAQGEG
jgi:hypothetical protein